MLLKDIEDNLEYVGVLARSCTKRAQAVLFVILEGNLLLKIVAFD